MENATKALLIAAAVLIAILLISLGVGVFSTAREQMGNADLSEYEVKKFNDKFTQYAGNNKSGADVNALLQTVFTHNNAQEDTSLCVGVGGDATVSRTTGLTSAPTKVSTGSRYNVTCTYDADTGLVTTIDVDEI